MNRTDLSGKTAIVTGAARGIGAAIAARFAAAGACVVVADIDTAAGEAEAAALRGAGAAAGFARLDVADEDDWRRVVAETVATRGGLDIVVNNAGVEITTPITDVEPAQFRRLLDVNVTGVLLGLKHGLRAMRPGGCAGRGGAILNIASTAALTAFPATGPYAATKAAVDRLTRVAAVEAGRFGYGVRINALFPGFVRTDLSAASARKAIDLGFFPDAAAFERFLADSTPLGRVGAPEEVAEAALFLCSDAASYVTAAGLCVSGGLAA